jgi:hypothetical protein
MATNRFTALDPEVARAIATYNNPKLTMRQRVGLDPISGPKPPQKEMAANNSPQQPTIPIQTAQGAPQYPSQSLGTASNSGVVGASPFANQAITGGGGMPIGGLPTQSPMQDYSSPQQVNPQLMQQPPIAGPMNPQYRMQAQMQALQKFRQLLARLGVYA